MPRLIPILFLLAGIGMSVSGQNYFQTNTPIDENEKALYLKFENTGFFKNNEFESSLVDGYTLTGNWLRPKLVYLPSEKIQLELGWHYLRYNGAEDARHSLPWFSARINFTNNWQFILSSLNNSHNHELVSPICEPERFLTDKPEAGFQILHNSEKLLIDGWLNWEQFIHDGDPFQEHITTGVSLKYRLFNSENFKLFVPFQALIHHRGGEIDSSPLKVQTLINTASGLNAEISTQGFIQQINFSVYYLTFKDGKGNAELTFKKGYGLFSSNSFESKIGKLGFEYWYSENYFGVKGMQLLQVVSGINPEYPGPELNKNMFSIFYVYEKEFVEGLIFAARIEGWFEPKHKYFSNMAAIYLVVNQDFLLKQF